MSLKCLSSAQKGHYTFLLAIRGFFCSPCHHSLLSPVLHEPNHKDQPWGTAWSLLCFLFSPPSSNSWPLSQSCLQFSPALSGGTSPVQFPSFVPVLTWPGPVFTVTLPTLFTDIRNWIKMFTYQMNDKFGRKAVTKWEIYRFKTTCQIHWYLFLIFVYQGGMIEDPSSRILSPEKHRFQYLTGSNLILWL